MTGGHWSSMERRSFLRSFFIAILIAFCGISFRSAARPATPNKDGILYWVVVDGPRPFVFGVKNEAELKSFRRAQPEKFYDVKKARAAARDLATPKPAFGTFAFA